MDTIHFQITLLGTKAEIEAVTGLKQGRRLAYATDTDELGTYDGSTWHWGTLDSGVAAGQYRQFTYVVSGGNFSFIIDADGNPIMALQDLE